MSNTTFSVDNAAKRLPLGESAFERLRHAGQIYVDKTALIYSLACARRPLFLSRPRRFGKTHVFAPWSVLNFLKIPDKGFLEYRYDSAGTPTVLLDYLKDHSLKDPTEYGQDIRIDIDELKSTGDPQHISDTALLAHTGYLSIKEAYGDSPVTNYPNAEVGKSMAKLYRRMTFSKYDVEKKTARPHRSAAGGWRSQAPQRNFQRGTWSLSIRSI